MINISAEDAKLFEQNGFTKEQVRATVQHYREQGLSDDDIQLKMNNRINEFKGVTSEPKEKKGIDITPSGIYKSYRAAIETPATALKDNISYKEAYKKNREYQEQAPLNKVLAPAIDIGSAFALPQANAFKGAGLLPRLGNYGLTGAGQGAVIGGLGGLKKEGLQGLLPGAGQGLVWGGALGAGLPLLGNISLKGFNAVANTPLGQYVGRVSKGAMGGLLESFAMGKNVIDRMAKSPRGTDISKKSEYFGSNDFMNDIARRLKSGVENLRQQEVTKFAQARDNILNNNPNAKVDLSDWYNGVIKQLQDLGYITEDGILTPAGQRAEGLKQLLNDLNYYNGVTDINNLQLLKSNVLDDIINYQPMAGQTLNNSTRGLQSVARDARKNINDILGNTLGEEYKVANQQLSEVLNALDNVPEIKDLTNAQNVDVLANKLKRVGTTRQEAINGLNNLERIMNDNGITISENGLTNDILDYLSAREVQNRIRTGADAMFRNVPRRALVQPATEFYVDRILPLTSSLKDVGKQIPAKLVPLLYGGPRLYGGVSND